jgi:pyridoxamine 5'-phosphate oxidase
VEPPDLATLRESYEAAGIDPAELDPDPLVQWRRWWEAAATAGVTEPNGAVLATVDAEGHPDARYVLVRRADEHGFAFYTDGRSPKAADLVRHPACSLVFGWLPLHRQVRVRGHARRLPDADVDAYFASRPRGSQLAAWASHQSAEVASRATLEERMAAVAHRFEGADVPRPPHWCGFAVVPESYEFWQGRANRFHDRVRYDRSPRVDDRPAPEPWVRRRLSP